MASQVPLRILCLDGGGVKGLSSLYILKELMAQIRRNKELGTRQKTHSHLRPCDYFDLICGTGTGGLLAIMLGRLQYDIDTAIKTYVSLATAVFETSSSEDCALFDTVALETEMRRVIKASPDGSKEDATFDDPRVTTDTRNCRTFVLASRPEGSGKAAVRMRTYATDDNDPFQAQIWQVARATSAAPTYFLPIDINGIRYGDGRIGWNNPTLEAINEANYVWPGRSIACVVSVGTGLEDAIQLATESKAPSIAGVLGQLFRSLTPKQAFELAVAQYCVSSVASCERIHNQIASNTSKLGINGPWQYVRLNVPQGMAKIGLQEWKKFHIIAALTEDYMEDIDVRELKRQVAERLSTPTHYEVSAPATASVPNRAPTEMIAYAMAQRQIEARSGPATNTATTSNFQESDKSNVLVRQQGIASRQQQGSRQVGYAESSSDESVSGAANRGRLRHPRMASPPSPPISVYPLQKIPSIVYSEDQDTHGDDDGKNFNVYMDGFERSATVLCCEYHECQSMGALQKDYLRDHYVTSHNEFLIKPSLIYPPATSRTHSRSLRCSACLRKLTDDNEGRKCENCQPVYEPIRKAAATGQSSTVSRPTATDVATDVATRVPKLFTEALPSREESANADTGNSVAEEEAEGNAPPQSSFWTPPEIPEHWTSYTPSTPRRVNANTGHSRTRPLSSYRSSHSISASVRKARDEYRRQRLHHENA